MFIEQPLGIKKVVNPCVQSAKGCVYKKLISRQRFPRERHTTHTNSTHLLQQAEWSAGRRHWHRREIYDALILS